MTTYHGYMVEADFDGEILRMRGTNKAGRVALAGAEHADGDVVLPRAAISDVALKGASMLVNGNLRVTAADGKKYQLHFRKKQASEMEALAQALGARTE